MFQILLQGMAVGVALSVPIGPINIEILRRALAGGFASGWFVGLGAVSADTLFCALVVTGVAPFADRPALRAPLYLLGAVVLVYLGFSGLWAAPDARLPAAGASTSRSYRTGFLMAVGNPMGIVYWLSIGAALIAAAIDEAGRAAGPVLVAGVFSGILLWVTLLAGMAQAGRSFVSPRLLLAADRLGSAVLIGFGVYFGWLGVSELF